MKRIIAFLLIFALTLTSCGTADNTESSSAPSNEETSSPEETTSTEETASGSTYSYAKEANFGGLDDKNLLRYVEDNVYSSLVDELDSDEYFVQNVSTQYVSKEYLEEIQYNSQENIYFGYALSDIEAEFQGEKYVFTLGEDGKTVVQKFEDYDDTFDQVLRNIAIGTGVILVCVTVSVVTAGAGAPVVSAVFAASAKTATTFALSSGAISGAMAGVVTGIQTGDVGEALKAAALEGSEGFKVGAITGALVGGVQQGAAIKKAADALKGSPSKLTPVQAAKIQKESKYPLDVIKQFNSVEEYEVYKNANLAKQMVDGKLALVQKIEANETNMAKMLKGNPPLDPNGVPYELHHIGQKADSTLAILTKEEHRIGENYSKLHRLIEKTEAHADDANWESIKKAFWKDFAKQLQAGGA